jgi:hypothetical protein
MIQDEPPAADSDGQPDTPLPTEGQLSALPASGAVVAGARSGSKRQPIRRVSKPRLTGAFDSPVRNLIAGVAFTLSVMTAATAAYMNLGWSFRDAFYMVVLTVYTVGYGEVRPIDSPMLSFVTISLIVLGCTGIIFLTGALVQYFTVSHLDNSVGLKRMNSQIDQLKGHVIVCGYGRTAICAFTVMRLPRTLCMPPASRAHMRWPRYCQMMPSMFSLH